MPDLHGSGKRELTSWGASTIRIEGEEIECTAADACDELGDECPGGDAPEFAILEGFWERARAGEDVSLVAFVERHRAQTRYIPSRGVLVVYGDDCTGRAFPLAVLPVRQAERSAMERVFFAHGRPSKQHGQRPVVRS